MRTWILLCPALCLSFFIPFKLNAQNQVKGLVKNTQGAPVEFATVVLMSAADSSVYVGTTTDVEGKFEFTDVPYPSYYVAVTIVGYSPLKSGPRNAVPLDTLTLTIEQSSKDLNEFTLDSRVNRIEFEAGKTTLNVENSTLSTGLTVLDLIKRIPGVFVDNEGNISIKGKSGINVMIDNRPTYLSGKELKNLLTSITASSVSKVEVITQPGASYDAEGNAGIINIILKKKMNLGFNGTLDAFYGQGFYPKAGGSFTFNYSKEKFNFYGSYTYSHYEGYTLSDVTRMIDSSIYDRHYWGHSISNNHMVKLGFDYFFNKKWSAGISANASPTHNNQWLGSTRSEFRNVQTNAVDSINTFGDNSGWETFNFSANLNTQWKIDTLGQMLTINADAGTYMEKSYGSYIYGYYDPFGQVMRTTPDVNYGQSPRLYLVSGKVDYVHPKVLGFKVETGIKSSYVTNEADVKYRTTDSTGQEIIIPGQSNHFLYQENINAIYLTLKRSVKKWSFMAGLRGEHTNVTGTQITTGQVNRQNYFSFFPSASISFNPNDKHALSIMYSRRIDRPEYNELNPFIYTVDNYSSFQGNPKLLPQFSHNFEISYTVLQALTFSTSYTLMTNAASGTFRFDSLDTKRLIFSQGNIGTAHNFTAGVNFAMPVTKWMYMYVNANAIYNNFRDTVLNFSNEGWFGMFAGYFEFYLPKKFTIELNAYFLTGQPQAQQISQPMGEVSMGISKKLFKEKLTIKFNVSDIFRTTKWRATTFTPTGESFNSSFWWDSRVFNLSLSWSFGQAGKSAKQKQNDSIFDRVGGGR